MALNSYVSRRAMISHPILYYYAVKIHRDRVANSFDHKAKVTLNLDSQTFDEQVCVSQSQRSVA